MTDVCKGCGTRERGFGAWQSLTPGVCITICWLRRRFTLSLVTLIYTMTLVPKAFVEMENA